MRAWGAAGGSENRIWARNVGYFRRVGRRVRVCCPKSARPDPALFCRSRGAWDPNTAWPRAALGPGISGRGLAFSDFFYLKKHVSVCSQLRWVGWLVGWVYYEALISNTT